MANILTMRRLLGFKDFFPNEKPKEKEFYASKLGKEIIEKSTCFFLSFLRHKGTPDVDVLFQEWFTFYDFKWFKSPTYWQIDAEYRRIKNHHQGEQHSIISVESLLNMFLWVRNNIHVPDLIENHDASSSLPLLELVLLFNDEVLVNYEKATQSIAKYGDDRKMQRLILAGSFSQSDLINIDYAQLLYTQIYKKAKLLKFIEGEQKYSHLLIKLLAEFKCETKEEFLKAVGAVAIIPLKSEKPSWTILSLENTPDKEKSVYLLDQLAIDEADATAIEQDDYLQLRNKPFQKLNDQEYRITFELFLIKKIYNGLIFKLSSYDKRFLGNIRDDFSEGVLVYETLSFILDNRVTKFITGNEFKEAGLKREPDFYCRRNNLIMLFESKDFFMRGEHKLSYDFNIIEAELMKDGRLKKAVIQIVTNIERCLLSEIPIDDISTVDDKIIFPTIIVHDSIYSAPALNFWVYYWFIDELQRVKDIPKLKHINFDNIRPITVIEIDTLILYEGQFKNGNFDLATLIERYHDYVQFPLVNKLPPQKIEEHALKSAISFSEFVRDIALSNGIDINFAIISKMLNEYGIK